MQATVTVTPAALPEVLLNVALVRPVFLWGAPGIGKSSLVRAFAESLGRSEAGVNRYFSGGGGGYGVAVAGDRVQRRLTETDARTRRSEWCQALYCEG